MSLVNDMQRLHKEGKISPPKFLLSNIHYLALTGSIAYGCNLDNSDWDIHGFCVPPKDDIFPHLRGEIPGFGRQKNRFDVWSEHHVKDTSSNREYDFSIYSIIKFFHLLMDNNPNIADIISVPQRCVLQASPLGQMVRDNRKLFFHKGSYHKFRGYAFAQMAKLDGNVNRSNPKRAENIEKFGWDLKFGSHVVRLALEAEMLLTKGDLELDANSQLLLSIRRGEWSLEELKSWFSEKVKHLEHLYATSTVLPFEPDEDKIKNLLMNCLENHYGSLSEAVVIPSDEQKMLQEMQDVIDRYKRRS